MFPILIGRDDVLVYLLTVAAPVTIVVHAVTLGAQTRLPMADKSQMLPRLASSLSGVLLASSCLSAVFIYVLFLSEDITLRRFIFGLFVLLPCQAIYFIALALGTADLSYSKLMYSRLLYGSLTFVGTLLMGGLGASPLAFLLVNAFGYLGGAVPIILGRFSWGLIQSISLPTLSFYGFGSELVAARYVVTASIVSGLGSQVGALITPLVPSSDAGAWATAIRIMTGLQTVGGHILGPKLDIGFLAGIRECKARLVRSVWRKGLVMGATLGAICIMSSLIGVAWIDIESLSMPIAIAMLGYSATSVFLAPIDRSLTLLGGQRERLVWDVIRAAGGLAIVLCVPRDLLLVSLATLGICSLLSYVYLLKRRVLVVASSGGDASLELDTGQEQKMGTGPSI
ncbi:hypothetical protein [Arthrobacter sp. Alg241-R88]|uniref:hypothetical protein n=1 Tax=Arthrobacter sp. Alg241-R88 TaxID=2305984 RepID=UPI00196878E1|nr:hypothetical protein [Arthrobacter sp. Alg241-R88]